MDGGNAACDLDRVEVLMVLGSAILGTWLFSLQGVFSVEWGSFGVLLRGYCD